MNHDNKLEISEEFICYTCSRPFYTNLLTYKLVSNNGKIFCCDDCMDKYNKFSLFINDNDYVYAPLQEIMIKATKQMKECLEESVFEYDGIPSDLLKMFKEEFCMSILKDVIREKYLEKTLQSMQIESNLNKIKKENE